MIILIEPQCKGFAHEQVNAGFLRGYSLAFPEEKLIYFAEKEHISCIQEIFVSCSFSSDEIDFIENEIPDANRLSSIFRYYLLLKKVLQYAYEEKCNRIVFLSIHTFNLIPLKILLKFRYNRFFKIHIIIHGIIESVKKRNYLFPCDSYGKVFNLTIKLFRLFGLEILSKPGSSNRFLYEKLLRASLNLFGNKNITYFVFRSDSLNKIKELLPKIKQHFGYIDHPYLYTKKNLVCKSDSSGFKIFATLGQGNLNAVNEVVRNISPSVSPENDFEIRIIGGNPNQSASDYERIKIVGKGRSLTRNEIENQMIDVHYVLFFYSDDLYELMTSGSFFDAISYKKPMIFIKNNCFDYYYKNFEFGYRCNNINEIIGYMKKIIAGGDHNYTKFESEIIRMQMNTSIENNYLKLRFN
jgi:hypothetical protein